MGWQDAPVKNAWEAAPVAEKPLKSYTTGEALISGAKQFLPSTGKMLVGAGNALIHPINTIDVLSDLGAGAVNKILPKSVQEASKKFDVALLGSEKAQQFEQRADQLANAVGKDYVNTYGSYEGFKRALAEDPARVLADVSTVLYGGGAALKAGELENAANIANKAAKYTNPLNIATSAVGKTAQLTNQGLNKLGLDVTSIPKHLLAFQAGKNPETFNTIYQAYRQNRPELQQAISEATPLGQNLYGDAIYNYARAYNLPHDVAILAEDYTRGHPQGLGAWDLVDKQYELYPNAPNAASARAQMAKDVYKPFAELTPEEQLKQATQAGVDTSVWNPIPARTGKNDFYNIAKSIGKKGIISAIAPSLAPVVAPLSSPRLARMATILAAKGANLTDKIPLSVDQANELGLMLYQMNQNKEQQ
jgi:hypothetical protein